VRISRQYDYDDQNGCHTDSDSNIHTDTHIEGEFDTHSRCHRLNAMSEIY